MCIYTYLCVNIYVFVIKVCLGQFLAGYFAIFYYKQYVFCFCLFWSEADPHYLSQALLELWILLSQPPTCCANTTMPSYN